MKARGWRVLVLAWGLVLATGGCLGAVESDSGEFEPLLGQSGKDVMWLPTAQSLAERMLDLAQVTAADRVIDLGSGDGRIVIAAAKRGAEALGIEFNPDMVALAQRNAARAGVAARARFVQGDIFQSDFSRATVLTLFLLPELNLQLRPTILAMRPGTRIVSNSFDMGEWIAERVVTLGRQDACEGTYCQAYLWIVPAQAEGRWKLPQGELMLRQRFQMLTGTLHTGRELLPIADGRLTGTGIVFRVGEALYTGRVEGERMAGTVRRGDGDTPWEATRLGR